MAEALYRKYRPQIFEDVVGQEHIERTLKNAISSDKVSHAYLFTGPRGTGKTTTARLLAKALLCQQGPTPDPDGTCEDCELVAAGEHPDVYELDAASRTGVENVREEIIGRVNYAPTRGRYKVYIIDEVHMLSTAAFNALLKTLEEPPEHVVFVLCTTDPQKVPETIHSRCQRFDFRRISNEELVSRLGAICEMEGIDFEGDALDLIAHRADGGMRDALTSLEQLIAFGEGSVTTQLAERLLGSLDSSDLAEIVRAIGTRDVATAFRWTTEYMETGADLAQFAQDLASHMRDMYVMQLAGAETALDVTEAARRELESESAWFGPDRLANLLGVLGDLIADLKTSTNQRLSFEIALTRMVRPDSDLTLAALAERIEALESGVSATAPAPAIFAAQPVAVQQPSSAATSAPNVSSGGGEAESVGKTAAASQSAQQTQPVQQAPSSTANRPAKRPASAQASQTGSLSDPEATPDIQQKGSLPEAAQLPQFWATVLAHLKKANQAYGVLLMNTQVQSNDSTLEVLFPSDAEFYFKAAQNAEVKTALGEALAKAGAAGIVFEFRKADASKSAKGTQSPDPSSAPVAATAPPATSVEEPEPAVQSTSASVPPWETFTRTAISDAEAESSSPSDISTDQSEAEPEPTASQLNDALAAAFGDGIQFEQVD